MNVGLINEEKIIDVLNRKMIRYLPYFWQKFIHCLFPDSRDTDIVICVKAEPHKKEDIVIIVNNSMKTVSIKSGHLNSVHSETINRFCGFLKWCGISDESITTLKLYHFGDGTIDGTGTNRIGIRELNVKYKEEIKKFNAEVNDKKFLLKIILRLINLGTPEQKSKVDYLYYGNEERGVYCDMYWLCNYLSKRPFDESIESIHFGPFTYDNKSRELKKEKSVDDPRKMERYYCKIKWNSIEEDLNEFKNKRFIAKANKEENL